MLILKSNSFAPTLLILLLCLIPAYSESAPAGFKHGNEKAIVAVIPYDSPPSFFHDSKTGNASGFEVDVLNKIAEQSGLKVTYIYHSDWDEMIGKVRTGKADLIPGLAITDDRKKKLAFTGPLDTFPVSLFVRSGDSTIKGLRTGLEVGVIKGSVAYEYFKKQNTIRMKLYDSYTAALFDLLAGRIDAFPCPQPTLLALAREAGIENRINIVGAPVTEVKRAIGVRKNDTALLERLNKGLNRFVGSPEYQELYRKWYGQPSSFWTTGRVVFVMSAVSALAILLMAFWRYISIMKLNRELLKTVTELKQTKQNRIRLETAIISAADAIVLTDRRGIIQYVNPAFERLTGFTREEAIGRDLHILDSGKQDESYYREMREALQRDGVWTGRLVNKKKDNSLYEEECTFSQVRELDGNVINYVGIKRDITEKLRLESIAASMDNMNNIGYIFSGVRHEIGNPVNALRLLLTLIKKRLANLDKEAIQNYIDRSLTEISKMDYLLSTLRNFNMYEKLDIRNVDVRDFLDKFIFLVNEDFLNKGIGISFSIEPGADVICSDSRALQQVLVNLLTNASDAVQGRENPKIRVSVLQEDHKVRIRIEDNGKGMTEEEQRQLFKPFYTTKAHGTGLGMVIVKKMLTEMNSTIEVRSCKDEGTIVDVLLPAQRMTSRTSAAVTRGSELTC